MLWYTGKINLADRNRKNALSIQAVRNEYGFLDYCLLSLLLLVVFIPGIALAQSGADGKADQYRSFLNQYCVSCHNATLKTAGLILDQANVADVSENPRIWESVITKLTMRAMPPVGIPLRPAESEYEGFLDYLQTELDRAAEVKPDPGRSLVHRLNRTEYRNAIRDLLGLEVDTQDLLPADNISHGFDNIAEVLAFSPLLMERYMYAAGQVSRLALGPVNMQPASQTYNLADTLRQTERMNDDMPFASRGGTVISHNFPMDGEYTVRITLLRNLEGYIRGLRDEHTLEVRLDHKRVGAMKIGGEVHGRSGPIFTENQVVHYAGDPEQIGYEFTADEKLEFRIPASAGAHKVSVAFLEQETKPTGISTPQLSLQNMMSYKGGKPAVANVTITGPYNAKGPGETVSRQKIFICTPASATDERCAEKILTNLARQAYRRTVTTKEKDQLMGLFRTGVQDGDFTSGIDLALQSILAGPEFLFRIEKDPADAKPGDVYAISDIELASRLSFFLWSSIPDDELLDIAEKGRLHEPRTLEKQVKRMMADSRFETFIQNFGRQWLSLTKLELSKPLLDLFPAFDGELREAYRQEMALWFESMIREDHSVLELLTSDYTFVNERLARQYGIKDVYGSKFRRVSLAGYEERQGLMGKGGLLLATAFNNRTSPVLRGKWVLENLLNMPPPPPPDDVPALQVKGEGGKALTLKQAMEAHRANPVCSSCHKLMDPIGFALENFDAIGSYRSRYLDANAEVDSSGVLFDGSQFNSPREFRTAFMKHSRRVVHTAAQKVLTYALGRPLDYYDAPAVRNIVNAIEPENNTWSALIQEVINSKPFRYRRVASHDNL
jgi:hypothetical protein